MMDPIQYLDDGTKHLVDAAAAAMFFLNLMGVALPHLLTAATLVWVLFRIWEMQTTRQIIAWFKVRRWFRKLEKPQASLSDKPND